MQALSTLALGGHGFLCSEGNLVPQLCGEVQRAIRSGDSDAADGSYRRLIEVFSLNIWPGGTVRFLKAAMRILGMPGCHTRPPFEVLDGGAADQLARAMKELALPEWSNL